MHTAHIKKLNDLIASASNVMQSHHEWPSDVRDEGLAQQWMISAVTTVEALCTPTSSYVSEIRRLAANREPAKSTSFNHVRRVLGILNAVREDSDAGILRSPEDIGFATALDNFLDHAVEFHRAKKYNEAAVLGAVVLEDAMKRLAQKHGVVHSGQSLGPLIDSLTKANVFTGVKAKRFTAYAGVRNAALHADWAKIDPKDVDEMLRGVREILEVYLA